jgi:hypothetical protein
MFIPPNYEIPRTTLTYDEVAQLRDLMWRLEEAAKQHGYVLRWAKDDPTMEEKVRRTRTTVEERRAEIEQWITARSPENAPRDEIPEWD